MPQRTCNSITAPNRLALLRPIEYKFALKTIENNKPGTLNCLIFMLILWYYGTMANLLCIFTYLHCDLYEALNNNLVDS